MGQYCYCFKSTFLCRSAANEPMTCENLYCVLHRELKPLRFQVAILNFLENQIKYILYVFFGTKEYQVLHTYMLNTIKKKKKKEMIFNLRKSKLKIIVEFEPYLQITQT